MVLHELPKAVRAQDQEAVRGAVESVLRTLRLGGNAGRVGHSIAQTSAHGEAWDVGIAEPNSGRAFDTVVVLDGEDSASGLFDPLLLVRLVGFVVSGKRDSEDASIRTSST